MRELESSVALRGRSICGQSGEMVRARAKGVEVDGAAVLVGPLRAVGLAVVDPFDAFPAGVGLAPGLPRDVTQLLSRAPRPAEDDPSVGIGDDLRGTDDELAGVRFEQLRGLCAGARQGG